MLTNGKILTVENDFLKVRIGTVGAALLSGEHKEYGDFLVYIHDDEFSDGYVGKTIAPWVNRVKNGEYSVDGQNYYLPINDVETNSALHGLVAWNEFSVLEEDAENVLLSSYIYPSPSFPFKAEVLVKYFLEKDVLNCDITVTNLSNIKIPIGICSHPYIKHPNAESIDECAFSVVSETGVNDNQSCVLKADLNYLGNFSLDNCYEINSPWKVILSHKNTKQYFSKVIVSSNSKYLQLYSGESVKRRGFAVEPCTSGVDMYGETKKGEFLEPGSRKKLQYTIRVEP